MPTDKQTIAYVKKRIKLHDEEADRFLTLQKNHLGSEHSALYSSAATSHITAATALRYVQYFIENGKEHPDLGAKDN